MITNSLLIFLHILIGTACLSSLMFTAIFWKERKKVSKTWRFFTFGLFFLLLSELVDVFTLIIQQPSGLIGLGSLTVEIIGLAFIFVSIFDYFRRRIER